MNVRPLSKLRIEVHPHPHPRSLWRRVKQWLAPPPQAYTLTDDLAVEIDDGERPVYVYTVPAGTAIDGFTVPRGFRWIIQPIGPHAAAAAVHDDMYVQAFRTKQYADDVFDALLRSLGCPRWARMLAYFAVSKFGRGNYERQ